MHACQTRYAFELANKVLNKPDLQAGAKLLADDTVWRQHRSFPHDEVMGHPNGLITILPEKRTLRCDDEGLDALLGLLWVPQRSLACPCFRGHAATHMLLRVD